MSVTSFNFASHSKFLVSRNSEKNPKELNYSYKTEIKINLKHVYCLIKELNLIDFTFYVLTFNLYVLGSSFVFPFKTSTEHNNEKVYNFLSKEVHLLVCLHYLDTTLKSLSMPASRSKDKYKLGVEQD